MGVIHKVDSQQLPAEQNKANKILRGVLRLLDKFMNSYTAYKAAELQRIYDLPDPENSRNRRL